MFFTTLMHGLYAFLPKVLNWLANNPNLWSSALKAVQAGRLQPNPAEYFHGAVAQELETTKHPTRLENFVREAALLYADWKVGKIK